MDYLRRLIELEDSLAPLELANARESSSDLPEEVAQGLGKTYAMMMAGSKSLRPYVRTEISSNLRFYSAGGAKADRSLLLCFCGNLNRMMIPIPVFLQFVPHDHFDVLIAKDPTKDEYIRGVPDYAGDLAEFLFKIRLNLGVDQYRDIRCLGTSAGGGVALYAGIMLNAERAIAVCGKHRTLAKVALNERDSAGARDGFEFDRLIQQQYPTSTTTLLGFHGRDFPRDVIGTASLKRRLPSLKVVNVHGLNNHSVLPFLLYKGLLHGFFQRFLINPVDLTTRKQEVDA